MIFSLQGFPLTVLTSGQEENFQRQPAPVTGTAQVMDGRANPTNSTLTNIRRFYNIFPGRETSYEFLPLKLEALIRKLRSVKIN